MTPDQTFDIDYGYFYNLSNERFYSRLDGLLNFVQLVGGSAAAAGAMQSDAKLVVGAGVALAVCAAISIVVQPAVKAERHCQMKTRWRELLAYKGDDIADQAAKLQASGPIGMGILAMPSYNAALRSRQHDDTGCRELSWLQKMVSAIC